MKILPEETYGKLTVISFSHDEVKKRLDGYNERHHIWLCKCECGNEVECDQYCLISGNTKSCGCGRRRYDLTGKNFGDWSVIKRAESRPRNNAGPETMWLCQCKCGKIQEVSLSSLIKSKSTQCLECYPASRSTGHEQITGKYWNSLIAGARARNIPFEVDLQFAWGLFRKQAGKCALSGELLTFGKNQTASLDRINSAKSYIPGNVQWVHKKINRCKGNLQDEDFISICNKVSNCQSALIKSANLVLPTLEKNILIDGFPIVVNLQRSFGSWIVDAKNNKKYLDCFGNFGSQALGWNHPALVRRHDELASVAQIKIAHSDIYTEVYANFVKLFSEFLHETPNVFFISGGALGVENAIKAAFDWTVQKRGIENCTDKINQLDIVHFENAFHGRSGYTLSLTNTDPTKTKWFPKFPWTRLSTTNEGLERLEQTLKKNNVAAVIIEPILGEGGDIHNTREFLETLRRLTFQYECLLIFDEVQTGFSTGKAWCYQHFNVIPDLISFGKKVQVCGCASTNRINEVANNVFNTPGRINSTWGADIVDIVRSTIIMETIKEEGLLEQSAKVGDYFLSKLKELNLSNARGRGLMIAFDLHTMEERDAIHARLCEKMLCLKCGSKSIRFRPHLSFTEEDADSAVAILKGCINPS